MVNLDLSRLSNSEISSIADNVGERMPDGDLKEQLENRKCKRRCCKRLPDQDSEFCLKHEREQRQYNKDYDKRRRAKWAAENRCMRCGAEKRKHGRPWCPACIVRYDRGRKSDHKSQLENQSKQARLAKRLIPWANSPQNEGRTRLRGGKRGAPGHEDLDRRDLADLQRHLARYTESVDETYGPDYAGMSVVQKEATRRALHAGLAWMARFCAEACKVRGYELPVVEDDEIASEDDESDD